MISAILIIHVIVCFFLILIVLLQTGKGADIGAAFGGTSTQTLFGSTGGNTFFNKLTIGVATVFMLTCLLLAYFSTKPGTSSIMKKAAETAPVQQTEKKQTAAESKKTEAAQQTQAVQEKEQAKTTSTPATSSQPATTTNESSKTSKQANPSAESKGAEQKTK
ncbi:MAG TPA: preprotein translocase subunit SecG [Deltaproteobacteria bacterium]|nr:MAG: preprotein translocase subunit SecG [Deltaproteobacteria bacterium]HDM77757.1 preprotein translocase subunit SecG [Deltaproteobacteria bacterium]